MLSSAMRYWILQGDAPIGPFDTAEIQRRLRAIEISKDTLVCPEGGASWRPLVQILIKKETIKSVASTAVSGPGNSASANPLSSSNKAYAGAEEVLSLPNGTPAITESQSTGKRWMNCALGAAVLAVAGGLVALVKGIIVKSAPAVTRAVVNTGIREANSDPAKPGSGPFGVPRNNLSKSNQPGVISQATLDALDGLDRYRPAQFDESRVIRRGMNARLFYATGLVKEAEDLAGRLEAAKLFLSEE